MNMNIVAPDNAESTWEIFPRPPVRETRIESAPREHYEEEELSPPFYHVRPDVTEIIEDPSPNDAESRNNDDGDFTVYTGHLVGRINQFRRLAILLWCVAIVWPAALVSVVHLRPTGETVFTTISPTTSSRRSSVGPSVVPNPPLVAQNCRPSVFSSSLSSSPPSASPSPSVGPTVTTSPTTETITWTQVGDDVVGKKPENELGHAVALSGDGNRLVAPNLNKYFGVFDLLVVGDGGAVASTWEEARSDDDDRLFATTSGVSVATSSDGRFIIVGSAHSYRSVGAVFVFEEQRGLDDDVSSSRWVRRGQTPTGRRERDGFGVAVDVTDDGDVIAVGCMSGDGCALMFGYRRDANEWTVVLRPMSPHDAEHESSFGDSLALSADGSTLVVVSSSTPDDGNDVQTGAASIYVPLSTSSYDNHHDDHREERPLQTIEEPTACFGRKVAASADGSVVAVAAVEYHVRIYRRRRCEDGSFEHARFGDDGAVTAAARGVWFGNDVGLSADGDRLVVGAPSHGELNVGRTFVYAAVRRPKDEWTTTTWTLTGEFVGESVGDYFGYSVAISGNGRRVAISAVFSDDEGRDSGHARVYESNR